MTRALAASVVVLASAFATACGGSDDTLKVFAASSLREALPAFDGAPDYVFAGSDELAAQIRQGARADVFLAASPTAPEQLRDEGLADSLRTFATNRLVLVVTRARHPDIRSLADVGRPGIRLVVAAAGVPAGDYTRAALARVGETRILARAVSEEHDVKGVVAKVALGEAEAGFVYATDVKAVADDVRAIDLPAAAQPRIRYVGAVVTATTRRDEAARFLDLLVSADGRAALRRAGFGAP